MTTALWIILASAAYFVLASRERDAECVEALADDDVLEAEIAEE
jgi:hypothetical protein